MIRKTALPLPIIVSLLILFTSFYLIVILDEDCMFKASTITTIMLSFFFFFFFPIMTIMLSYIKTEECPDGHYCPAGTGYPFTYPCQAGKYRNNTLGQSGEACILCPSRHYCSSPGTHTPSVCPQVRIRLLKNCFAVWVRQFLSVLASVYVKYTRGTNGSFSPSVPPFRGFTVQTALLFLNLVLKEPTVLALLLVIGLNAPLVAEASIALEWDFQSPLEAAEIVFTAEREPSLLYANVITVIYSVFIQGIPIIFFTCWDQQIQIQHITTLCCRISLRGSKFLASLHSYCQTPVDGPTGGLCPAGSYCPLASPSPLPCPSGTFSNSTGLSRPEECTSCPPG